MTNKEAIEILKNTAFLLPSRGGSIDEVDEAIEALKGTTFRWIPVSERLPEERQWVLCQCRAKIMEVLRINRDHDWEQMYPKTTYMSSFVLAWMPLPEPYAERRTSDEVQNS